MRRRLGLALLVCLLAVGCCTPRTVYVPVPAEVPPLPPRPVPRIAALNADSTWTEIVEAYALDLAEERGYSGQLEAILKALGRPGGLK